MLAKSAGTASVLRRVWLGGGKLLSLKNSKSAVVFCGMNTVEPLLLLAATKSSEKQAVKQQQKTNVFCFQINQNKKGKDMNSSQLCRKVDQHQIKAHMAASPVANQSV